MKEQEVSVVMLAKEGNEIILINQFRQPINGYTIQLPGGGVNKNEDIEEAARREFLEETGFRCGETSFLGKLRPASWISNEVTYVFYTDEINEYVGQALESHERIEVIKKNIDELILEVKNGQIDDSELCYALLQGIFNGLIKLEMKGLTM